MVFLVIATVIAAFIYLQFRGDLADKTQLTLLSPRAGLVVERGSKVTFNGVEIGRVARIGMVDENGTQKAKLTLDVKPRYISYIPANVVAEIRATTVFGNKYISFSSPENPSAQRISAHAVIDASAVTTEFNTLFETVTSIAEQVDPIKVNQTLTATAEALTGLGERFGESLENGNRILDDLNRQMPQIRRRQPRGGRPGRRLRRRVAGPVGRTGERDTVGADVQRPPRRHRRGADGRHRLRQ